MIIGGLLGALVVVTAITAFGLTRWVPALSARHGATVAVLIVLALMALLGLWLTRFELVGADAAGSGGAAFRLDRWTGEVAYCGPKGCWTINWL